MEQEQLNTVGKTNDLSVGNQDVDSKQILKEKSPKLTANGVKKILEAVLFVASKPFKAKDFAKILELEESAVKLALDALAEEKKDSGIVLLENRGEYQLSTNSTCSPQVKNFLNAELREKLTDATVEVLAIIAYRQPISKAEIEAIRGVNSQYSLRHLLMRGLIEKINNPADARSFLYQTTTEFLMHMGMISVSELPEFAKLVENIKLPQTAGLNQQASPVEANDNNPIEELEVRTTKMGSQDPVKTENNLEKTQTESSNITPQEPATEVIPNNQTEEDGAEDDDEEE
jgi:segregation and condensation protein B